MISLRLHSTAAESLGRSAPVDGGGKVVDGPLHLLGSDSRK
jgi:hypothetical protein